MGVRSSHQGDVISSAKIKIAKISHGNGASADVASNNGEWAYQRISAQRLGRAGISGRRHGAKSGVSASALNGVSGKEKRFITKKIKNSAKSEKSIWHNLALAAKKWRARRGDWRRANQRQISASSIAKSLETRTANAKTSKRRRRRLRNGGRKYHPGGSSWREAGVNSGHHDVACTCGSRIPRPRDRPDAFV